MRAAEKKFFTISFDMLLAALLLLIVATPFLEDTHSVLLSLFFALVLFAGAYVTSYRRWQFIISGVLVIPWLLLALLRAGGGDGPLFVLQLVFFTAFTLYTGAIVLRHILHSKDVTRNILSGGVSVYFLLAISFAGVYAIIEALSPGAFYFPKAGDSASFSTYLYYSIATISTLGYGDIYPLHGLARNLSALEGAAGFLYIGIFIARLISQFRR